MPSNMLPHPASARRGPSPSIPRILFSSFSQPSSSSSSSSSSAAYASHQSLLTTLRARTRLTNLAVSLLLGLLSLSLLSNLSHLSSSPSLHTTHNEGWDDLATAAQYDTGIPLSIETTVERDPRYAELDHLVMVPGHAIWIGSDVARLEEDDQWVLESMQRGGSVRTFVRHIREGVEQLRNDAKALLIFSGGATRAPPSPPLEESQSYLSLATALHLLPPHPLPPSSSSSSSKPPLPLNLRAFTEEFALDSYQNLLFSLARFHEVTGRWPERVTVVGYGMKRRRFEQLHRAAIRFPADSFRYIGIDDEGDTTEHYAGEMKYALIPFLSSPSGCHPPLSLKRLARNPYFRYHPYHTSAPALSPLLEWCPPPEGSGYIDEATGEVRGVRAYDGEVPWRDGGRGGAGAEGEGEVRWGRETD